MRRPLCRTLTLLAWTAGIPPGFAADGLTAYRGQDWAYLEATEAEATLWLGPEQTVELPAMEPPGAYVRYEDLVLLGRDRQGMQEWAVAGVAMDRSGPRLSLHRGRHDRIRPIAPPLRRRGAIQIVSVRWMATEGAEPLQGLVWLEATRPRAQEVWLSSYGDGELHPATRLVEAGPGSQTALAGVALADGSWLLVWSAFDGNDDDLVWRQGRPDGSWTGGRVSPDNRVPDITPRLLVTPEGAAVAWSRYDGNVYRVRTARFEQGEWRLERWAAPPDSLYPEWVGNGGTLLFLRGSTRSWMASGPESFVEFAAPPETPPVVEVDPSGLLRARWPESGRWRSASGSVPGARP